MAQKSPDPGSYDEARKLAEDALDAYARGDPREGDRLAKQARDTNTKAVQDMVEELEEDRDTDHDSFVASDKDRPKDE